MLSLDSTTRAEYDAAGTADAKAQAVLAALVAPVYVRVYNASDTLVGSGQMETAWATRSGNVLTLGELSAFTVSDSGTPGAGWYLRFESGTRWVRGSFGPGGDFTWSLATWEAGQQGVLGTATITAATGGSIAAVLSASYALAGATLTFGWTITDVPWPIGTYTAGVGGTHDLSQYAYTVGGTPVYLVQQASRACK